MERGVPHYCQYVCRRRPTLPFGQDPGKRSPVVKSVPFKTHFGSKQKYIWLKSHSSIWLKPLESTNKNTFQHMEALKQPSALSPPKGCTCSSLQVSLRSATRTNGRGMCFVVFQRGAGVGRKTLRFSRGREGGLICREARITLGEVEYFTNLV